MSFTRSVFKILTVLLIFAAGNIKAQLVVTPHDTTVCGQPVTINASLTNGIGTTLSLSDDGYSGIIPIGFTFQYYGTNYTQCIIGANGIVNFNLIYANGACTWPIGQPIPGGPANNYHSIMGPWMDVNPSLGTGVVSYVTLGVAPNRKFIASWCDVPYFSCTNLKLTTQIVLYETSNLIEVHLTSRVTGCSWNSDAAIEGVQNASGTVATAVPGRNYPTIWGAYHSANSFTWNGATYTEAAIPFAPVTVNSNGIIDWYVGHPSNNQQIATNTNTITVTPLVPTTYYAQVVTCGDTVMDSCVVNIGVGDSISYFDVINPDFCGYSTGMIILHGLNPGDTFVVTATNVPSFQAVSGIDSTIYVTNLKAGTYTVSAVKVNGCPAPDITATLVDPPFNVDSVTAVNPTICGANDGYIKFWGVDVGNTPYIVTYDKDGVPQPAASVTSDAGKIALLANLAPGTYTNIMFANQYGCQTGPFGPFTFIEPPFSVDFDTSTRFGCAGDTVQFYDLSVGVTQYAWDFGDGNQSNLPNPSNIYLQQGVYTVTLTGTNGFCTDAKTITVPLVHPIDAEFAVSKDSICNGETIFFTDNSTGTNYRYEWDFGDGFVSSDPNPSHQYNTDGVYTAKLTIVDFVPCVSVETKTIVVASIDIAIGPKDTMVCLVDSMLLYSETFAPPYFSDGINYTWTPADNIGSPNSAETNFFTDVPGTYEYILTALGLPMGCVAKDTLSIVVKPKPILINVTPNQVIKYGSDIQLHAEGAAYYIWTPPATLDNPNISSPLGSPREPVVYSVYGMNEHGGCRDTALVVVDIDYGMNEFIPSVFSPNGDGKNDVFRLVNLKFQKLVEFRVFNRWGKEVFSTTDAAKGWDGTYNGTEQDPGVYTYLIRVNIPDGEAKLYKGNVTLVR